MDANAAGAASANERLTAGPESGPMAAMARGRRTADRITAMVSLCLAFALLVVLAAVGAWDVWVIFGPVDAPTVSFILYTWGQQFPPLVLAVGILLGHLFWPVQGRP